MILHTMPRLTLRVATSLLISLSLLASTACQKTVVPDEYAKMSFRGLSKITLNETGKVVLNWDSIDSAQSEGNAVSYNVYLKQIDSVGTSLSGDANTMQSLDLPETEQPKTAGTLLQTTGASSYVIESGLVSGKLYAFQVVAKAGPKTGDNNTVLGLLYVSTELDAYSLVASNSTVQGAAINTALTTPFTVKLTKTKIPQPGQIIEFSIVSGGGSLSASKVVTSATGQASVIYTTGPDAGTAQVLASWGGGTHEVTFSVFVSDPNSSSSGLAGYVLSAVSGNFQIGPTSTLFTQPLKVRLLNNGTALASKTINYSVTTGTGMVLSSATATTDASGYAQIQATAGSGSGAYVVHASYNSDQASTDFQLIAQAESKHLDVAGGNYQTSTISTLFPTPLKVRLLASAGTTSPMAGESIAFAVTAGSGASVSAATVTTDATGYAQVNFTAGATVGNYEVTATWGGLTSVFYLIGAAVPDTKVLEVASGNFQIDAKSTAFPAPLVARLRNSSTAMNAESVAFAITSAPSGQAGAALSAATATTNAAGLAQVNFTSGDKDGSYEITATWTDGTVTKTTTFAAIVTTNLASSTKIVKIVSSGAGAQPEVTTAALDLVADTLTVKAALYDLTGTTYLQDVSVAWSLTGGGFNGADLVGTPAGATSITFDPTRTGSTVLTATYMGTDTSVVGPSDSTGFFTVTTALVPGVISAAGGTGQTAVVGNSLATPLKVRVTSTGGVAVPGVGVNFTSQQGGGVVVTGQPVLTDSDGYASATVQLGTTAMTNIFRATVAGYASLTYDFSATAIAGAAAKLAFSTQPATAFRNFQFLTQPIVVIQDTYGNLITTANYPINLTKGAGAGAFVGTTTVTAANGIATFQNVGWDTQENGVTIVANSTPVLTTATSTSFNVAAPLASACTTENTNWKTQEGGCKHQSSGLVFSGSYGSMTWSAAMWDANVGGSTPAKASDYSRTNEYLESGGLCASGNTATCDTSSTSFCHDLNLGGYQDWRLPTGTEMQTAQANGISAAQSAYGSTWYWTKEIQASWGAFKVFRFDTGAFGWYDTTGSTPVVCVRGGTARALPTKIVWTTVPSSAVTGQNFSLAASVQTAAGTQVNIEGEPITISQVSGAGSLTGPTTVNTNKMGQAIFTFTYSGANESGVFSASSVNYGSIATNASVWFTNVLGGCNLPDDASFETAQGGCRDKATGLVWSKPSSTAMTWAAAVWDASVAGSDAIEASDNGWSAEYPAGNNPACASCDNDPASYCHSLTESGYSDWRLPTFAEAAAARSNGLATRATALGGNYIFMTYNSPSLYRFSDGATWINNGTSSNAVCVRGGTARPSPTQIVPSASANIAAQVGQNFSFSLSVRDATNAIVYRSGVIVTLTKTTGAGVLIGSMSATTDKSGFATFTFSNDTAEVVTFSYVNNAGLTNGTNIAVNVSAFPGGCMIENAYWTAADGGCKHIPTGKVFSRVSTSVYTWSEVIWNSAYAGSDAPDADDGARTNDYNGAQSFGDNNALAYCHSLVEGGKTDWRVPSSLEFSTIGGDNAKSVIAAPNSSSGVTSSTTVWAATQGTWNGGCGGPFISIFDLNSNAVNPSSLNGGGGPCFGHSTYAICVRP